MQTKSKVAWKEFNVLWPIFHAQRHNNSSKTKRSLEDISKRNNCRVLFILTNDIQQSYGDEDSFSSIQLQTICEELKMRIMTINCQDRSVANLHNQLYQSEVCERIVLIFYKWNYRERSIQAKVETE